MREITFKSVVGQADVDVPGVGHFENGQSRQVTDEQAEYLLRNQNFVEENPAPKIQASIKPEAKKEPEPSPSEDQK